MLPDADMPSLSQDVAQTCRAIGPECAPSAEMLTALGDELTLIEGETPIIAALADGGYVVVTKISSSNLVGQIYSVDGVAVGARFDIGIIEDGQGANAAVTGLANGGFVVTWVKADTEDEGTSGPTDRPAAFRIFDSNGNGSPEQQVGLGINSHDTALLALDDGGFVLITPNRNSSENDTLLQRYSASGTPVGPATPLPLNPNDLIVTTFSDGALAIMSTRPVGGTGIELVIVSADGQVIRGPDMVINPAASMAEARALIGSVAPMDDGSLLVVWNHLLSTSSGIEREVRGQIFAGDGSRTGAEFTIDTGDQSDPLNFSLIALSEGGYFGVWDAADTGLDVFARQFDAGMQPMGDVIRVNQSTAGNQRNGLGPVTQLSDGSIMVVWEDGSGTNPVSARRFTLDRVTDVVLDDFDNTWTGTDGRERVEALDGDDVLDARGGDDVIIGGGGNDTINGGDGYDVAFYSGVRGSYVVSFDGVSGGLEGGADTLSGVEELVFIDGRLSSQGDGHAAQVMRLYDAAFNRAPDPVGFDAQSEALREGVSLERLAEAFLNSAEGQSIYGGLDHRQFVERLYEVVLNRSPNPVEIDNTAASGLTAAQLLVAFSESAEHKDLTQGALDQGLWIADEQTLIIARLYDAAWNRLPDEGGLVTWRNALGGGMSLEDIADAFAGAAEFTNTYGALTDRQFIEQLYRNVLNREADEGGIQNALNAIAGGSSRGDIMLAFSESVEHISVTRDLWIGGVSLYGSSSAPVGAKEADEPLTLPCADAFIPLDAVNDDDALVLPGVDDALVWGKEADVALVLPGIDDGSVFVTPDHNGFDISPDDALHGLRNEGWMH